MAVQDLSEGKPPEQSKRDCHVAGCARSYLHDGEHGTEASEVAYREPWRSLKRGQLLPIAGWWFKVVGADYEQGALVLTPVEPCKRSKLGRIK